MPEYAEVRIMSNFINEKSKNNRYKNLFKIQKGNTDCVHIKSDFLLESRSYGKQLFLTLVGTNEKTTIDVFMSLMGNWTSIETEKWSDINFCRLRFDDYRGNSLILHGGYMGPKFSIDKPFTGTKRGPDPVEDWTKFKNNILSNFNKSVFNKAIGEVILNQQYFNGVGAYLAAEILGRADINPFRKLNSLELDEIESLLQLVNKCCLESYEFGGGELMNWNNPFGKSNINDWIKFYNNKDECVKYKFGSRNIWIRKKWKKENVNGSNLQLENN
jgi:endonuclease VIII-like 1